MSYVLSLVRLLISLASKSQTLDASSETITLPDTTVTNAQLANSSITIGDESSNVFDISLVMSSV